MGSPGGIRPAVITITLTGREKGSEPRESSYQCCHASQVGDVFDFARERHRLCPLAMHQLLPVIDRLRDAKGPLAPTSAEGRFTCPGSGMTSVFRLDIDRSDGGGGD